jgi:hypothetical protein
MSAIALSRKARRSTAVNPTRSSATVSDTSSHAHLWKWPKPAIHCRRTQTSRKNISTQRACASVHSARGRPRTASYSAT